MEPDRLVKAPMDFETFYYYDLNMLFQIQHHVKRDPKIFAACRCADCRLVYFYLAVKL
jgi:hypothetical protein